MPDVTLSVFTRRSAAVLAALAVGWPAWALPPVWVVKDRNSELLLFGSVHVLPPGLAWEPPDLVKALGRSDDLWFELPIDPGSEALTGQLAARYGLLPEGQSLLALLGPDDALRLTNVAMSYGLSAPFLDRFEPWLAEIALAGGAYRKAGAGSQTGVEKTIAAAASPKAKLRALESPEEQIAVLAGGPMAEQLASLRETLTEMENEPDAFAALVRAWMAGDTAELDRQALAPMRKASPELFKRLVMDRNARWAAALDARLKGRGRTVVVVGVGHLIGPGSLPERLRALGYSVTGP
jgi:uncharacterized protein YbaP (TraB family)